VFCLANRKAVSPPPQIGPLRIAIRNVRRAARPARNAAQAAGFTNELAELFLQDEAVSASDAKAITLPPAFDPNLTAALEEFLRRNDFRRFYRLVAFGIRWLGILNHETQSILLRLNVNKPKLDAGMVWQHSRRQLDSPFFSGQSGLTSRNSTKIIFFSC
jgi:hypothetical protein